MKLLVYIKDGRTVYALRGRGELARLMSREPGHEEPSVVVVRGMWSSEEHRYLWTPGIKLRFIGRGAVSHVEEGSPE